MYEESGVHYFGLSWRGFGYPLKSWGGTNVHAVQYGVPTTSTLPDLPYLETARGIEFSRLSCPPGMDHGNTP